MIATYDFGDRAFFLYPHIQDLKAWGWFIDVHANP